jgi:glycosyltransferase involved in cell wall biosynthesis
MAIPIAYVARMRMPTERAHGIQIMRMCEALASQGADVTLYYSNRRQIPAMRGVDPFEYYQVERNFGIKPVPIVDVIPLQHVLPSRLVALMYVLANALFGLAAVLWTLRTKADVYYTRHWFAAWWLMRFGRPTILELHRTDPQHMSSRVRWLLRRLSYHPSMRAVTTISESLKQELVDAGFAAKKLVALRDAVDLRRYAQPMSRADARKQTGLPDDRPLVVYTGSLLPNRGVDVLVRAAPELAGSEVVLVGGPPDEQAAMVREAKRIGATNIRFIDHIHPSQVPVYQQAADVLALPQLDPQGHSPLKLAEYMAAGRPIVASDLLPLREVLTDGETAVLVPPGDSESLAKGIQRVLSDHEFGERLAGAARQEAHQWTWERRAVELLELVEKHA